MTLLVFLLKGAAGLVLGAAGGWLGCWLWLRRDARQRVQERAAAERAWRLRVAQDGHVLLDLDLEQLRTWCAVEGSPHDLAGGQLRTWCAVEGRAAAFELGIPGPRRGPVHVLLRCAGLPPGVRYPLGLGLPRPAFPGPRSGSRAPCPPDG